MAKPAARIEFSLAYLARLKASGTVAIVAAVILVAWLTVAVLAYVWATGQKIDPTWLYPPSQAAGAAIDN